MVNNPRARKSISYLPLMTPLTSAANMRSLHFEASTHDHSRPRVSALCVVLSDTGNALLSLYLCVEFTYPPSCLPSLGAVLLPALFAAFGRCGTMKALTPAQLTYHAGLPAYLATPSCRSVSNHVGCLNIAYHHASVSSGFRTSPWYRRLLAAPPPNRVRFTTDRLFASGCSPPRFTATQLPSTSEFVAYSDTDFHRADVAPSRAHDSRVRGYDGTQVTSSLWETIALHVFSKENTKVWKIISLNFVRFVSFVVRWIFLIERVYLRTQDRKICASFATCEL